MRVFVCVSSCTECHDPVLLCGVAWSGVACQAMRHNPQHPGIQDAGTWLLSLMVQCEALSKPDTVLAKPELQARDVLAAVPSCPGVADDAVRVSKELLVKLGEEGAATAPPSA